MELPKLGDAGSMLDGLKSKLGFRGNADAAYDDEYYDDYDEYADDYGDYEEPVEPVRPARTASASAGSHRASRRSASSNLVSFDDVRAHTQVPESLGRDPLPPRRVTSAQSPSATVQRNGRIIEDSSLPFSMTPEGTAAVSAAASAPRRSRSEGLESLFTPTDAEPASNGATAGSAQSPSSSLSSPAARSSAIASAVPAVGAAPKPSFDPYEAYAGAGSQAYRASRSVEVLKPVDYSEVERVAKALKAGDAVVLVLRNTPDSLSKRILDFSFGVSAALDASVECIGDKVFALTRGVGLTDAERTTLRSQGVL